MGETIYVDKPSMGAALGVFFARNIQIVFTGLDVSTERDEAAAAEVSRLCGMDFFLQEQEPEISLYCVPYLEIFASDGQGGWFAVAETLRDGPVYYIDRDRTPHLTTGRSRLFYYMVSDPDWRRKYLPGGPWPRLPEDPAGRKKLAEILNLPALPPEEIYMPDALPRVFSSREEAEKEFPIQNHWTILRHKKTPRFQVHQMMSPEDREGRALVHCTAWRETYAGLMDPRILETHTLERCRKIAADSRSDDNFVVLDRENGDRVAGFVCFSRRARQAVSVPDAGELVALYVLEEYQGLGLGKMLLNSALAWIHRPRVALFVLKGNEKAIRFYEHMGFRFTGHSVDAELNGGKMTELEMVLDREAT